jgi:hypothetical protein
MVNRRRRIRKGDDIDESVGLSGWLYTDLMLGLAVVFLGAAVLKFPAVVSNEDGEVVPSTITTTLPPIELCSALYAPEGSRDETPLVRVRKNADPVTKEREFRDGLQVLYDFLNAKEFFVTNGVVLNIDSTKIGLILAQAGWNGRGTGSNRDATELRAELAVLLPEILQNTPGRDTYGQNVDPEYVAMEILPLIELPCGAS